VQPSKANWKKAKPNVFSSLDLASCEPAFIVTPTDVCVQPLMAGPEAQAEKILF
jgi:hypothetical protein